MFQENSIGYDLSISAQWIAKQKNKNCLWFEIGQRSHLHANLTKPLLELALNGNSYYAGENKDLSNISYMNVSWQFASVGYKIIKRKYSISSGISIVSGYWNTKANIYSGNVYTDKDGEYINIRLNSETYQSKPLSNTFIKQGGIGTAVNFEMVLPQKKQTFVIGFKDFGFVSWVNNPKTTDIDTTIHFEGLIINDFQMLQSADARKRIEDSLKQIPNQYIYNKKYNQMLPALFYIKYIKKMGNDVLNISLDYIYQAYKIPKLACTYYKIKNHHSINTQLCLGGYNYYDINIGYSWLYRQNSIDILVKGLKGIVAPSVMSGAGLFINFTKKI